MVSGYLINTLGRRRRAGKVLACVGPARGPVARLDALASLLGRSKCAVGCFIRIGDEPAHAIAVFACRGRRPISDWRGAWLSRGPRALAVHFGIGMGPQISGGWSDSVVTSGIFSSCVWTHHRRGRA